MTTYEYVIADAFPNHKVDAPTLYDEMIYDYDFVPGFSLEVSATVVALLFPEALSDEQKVTLDLVVSLHQGDPKPFEKKHYEQAFDRTRLIRETWWARSSGDVLSVKVEETLYTYSGSRLMTESWTRYNRDGSVAESRNWILRQQKTGTALIVRKVEQ